MPLFKFAWILISLLGAFLDNISRPRVFVGSMIAVLPTFVISLVVAGVVYFALKKQAGNGTTS